MWNMRSAIYSNGWIDGEVYVAPSEVKHRAIMIYYKNGAPNGAEKFDFHDVFNNKDGRGRILKEDVKICKTCLFMERNQTIIIIRSRGAKCL